MKNKVQKDILNFLEDNFIKDSIVFKKEDLYKCLNNFNFRNNQNYIISNKKRSELLKKAEYKSKYKGKYSNTIKIEYPYLTDFNGNRYDKILNIGDFGILNNIGTKKGILKIGSLLFFIFNLIKILFSFIFMFFKNNKYGKIIFGILLFGIVIYLYHNIDGLRLKYSISFYDAFLKYIFLIGNNLFLAIKDFMLGLLLLLLWFLFWYIYMKIVGYFTNKKIIGKYIFFSKTINTDNIILYRYK